MKKTVMVILAVMMLLPVMVFAGGQQEVAEGVMRIAVSFPPANNAWQAKMLDSALDEAAKDVDEFHFVIKNAVDDADQLNILTTFKEDAYDMIICLPGNGTLMTPICEDIYDAGIKLIIVDRPIDSDKYTALLGGDNYLCGSNAAKYMGDRLGGKGDIAILRSYVGIPIDLDRYNGFADVIKKDYPGINIVVEADGQFNQDAGLNAMSNILPAYDKIDAVYCQDDEAAVGAITAIENAGRTDVQFVTGFGGSKAAYKLLSEGNPIFGASMSYWPTMGGRALALGKSIFRGESFEKINHDPTFVVTKENVGEFHQHSY
ncbi:MAG TPA: hypothetical protein DCO79_06325 [Spirochaeta sp.]|nr:hypothetical protein [Spirochaeta sp.]